MPFRIAIGDCRCQEPFGDRVEEIACGLVTELVARWRVRLPQDLGAIPTEAYEEHRVEGLPMTLGTIRIERDEGGSLVVFQAFVHTWRRPTYLSLGAVGRMYAEGLVVSEEGVVTDAPNEEMWPFR